MEKNNCTNCRFSVAEQQNDPNGKPIIGQVLHRCHRFPPQMVVIPNAQGIAMSAQFPIVTDQISCAEWQPMRADDYVGPYGDVPESFGGTD